MVETRTMSRCGLRPAGHRLYARKAHGLTLIEVLVALVIVALGCLPA